jgi:hypothetical protein
VLLFLKPIFSQKKELSFLHKNHKNDLVEKKHAVPGARTHIRLSLSLSLSLCVSVFCIDI